MDRPPETQRDYWLSYILVPDVAKWQIKAEQLGAKTLVPKHAIKGQGEFSVHADPTGAVFALWADQTGR